MPRFTALSLAVAVLLLPALRGGNAQQPTVTYVSAGDVASSRMLPLTTRVAAARTHVIAGQRALDAGLAPDAYAHFEQAVAADSTFAFAHLGMAYSAPSLTAYREALTRASRFAPRASRAERLLIQIEERSLAEDLPGALAAAKELVRIAPRNPRAYTALAGVQSQLGKFTEARATLERAIVVDKQFAPAYIQLGNSYLLSEPRDMAKAETAIRKAVELEPNAYLPHDFLGDVYRATGRLAEARDAYTRAAELAPTVGLERQQRGHVNTFLGNWDEARADYDAAIALSKDNGRATFAVYRSLVPIYQGNPRAAIDELEAVVAALDTMSVPDRDGGKVFALTQQFFIAAHTGAFDVAERALTRRSELARKRSAVLANADNRRAEEGTIAFLEGFLALKRGDFAAATAKANAAMTAVAANKNPRKNEGAHELLGLIALEQKNYENALAHFAQGDPNNIYVTYYRALALEGAGRPAEAAPLLEKVATFHFNNTGLALVRADARARLAKK